MDRDGVLERDDFHDIDIAIHICEEIDQGKRDHQRSFPYCKQKVYSLKTKCL